MIKNIVYVLAVAAFLASSCTCSTNNDKAAALFQTTDSSVTGGALELDKGAMEDLVQNIGSPIETAELIKSMGVPFSQKLLAPTKTDNFNTSNSKALNLGVFAADLGYLNMYGKTSSVLSFITAIKTLADGINVGQFFDFNTLKRLATNNENIDSLIFISTHNFNVMDEYLRKNKRSNLSALMVAGVYVEGLYLTTQVAKAKPSKKLAENIGEQKVIFDQLLLILKNYQKDAYFANLISELESIKKDFNQVEITIKPGEPKSVEKNGMLTIVQTETSIVNISDETLNSIISKTESVRNKLIM